MLSVDLVGWVTGMLLASEHWIKRKTQRPQPHPISIRPGPKQKGGACLHLGHDYQGGFFVQTALLIFHNLMFFWKMQTTPPVPAEASQAAPSLSALAGLLAPSTALPGHLC